MSYLHLSGEKENHRNQKSWANSQISSMDPEGQSELPGSDLIAEFYFETYIMIVFRSGDSRR